MNEPMRRRRLEDAAAQVRQAIKDEGVNPRYHRDTMHRHRDEWPSLWSALDELVKVARR